MAYFKYFIYLVKNSYIKFLKAFLFLVGLVLCFLCIFASSNCVSANSLDTTLTPTQIRELESLVSTLDTNDEYDYFLYCSGARLILFNNYNETTSKFYLGTGVGNTTRVFSNFAPSGKMYYHIDLDNQTADYWGGIGSNTDMLYYEVSGYANLYANVPVYDRDQTTLLFSPVVPTPATIINTTSQSYENNLVNGSFEYIIVSAGDYAQYPVTFHINNGQDSLDSPTKYKYIVLDHDSPYADISIEPNQYQSWTIPKSDLIPIYNNYTYNMWLDYGENGSLSTEIYTWTTNFSQSTIDNAVVDEQENIDKTAENTEIIANEIGQTNEFLQDTTYDENELELPTMAITENVSLYVNDLFMSLYNIFTSDEYTDFTFEIPFSNGVEITIPSNYIESRLPSSIIILIRVCYWYVISRFIIKDIMNIVNRLRQGDYLIGSDVNIKTEVL